MSRSKRGTARKSKRASAKKAARSSAKRKVVSNKASGAKKSAATAPKRRDPENLRARSFSAGLTVGDIAKSIGWYRDVLGFHVKEEWRHEGKLVGATVLAGAASFYLGQDDWAKGRDGKKGEGFRVHLATEQDVDQIAARVEASGGKLESEPADMPWGTRALPTTRCGCAWRARSVRAGGAPALVVRRVVRIAA